MRASALQGRPREGLGFVRVLYLCAAVLMTLTASRAAAQSVQEVRDSSLAEGTILVSGVVSDASARPLVGAEVRIGDRSRALSDSAGRFTLRDVPFGRTELVVRRIGYAPQRVAITPHAAQVRLAVRVQLTETSYRLPEILVEGKAYDRGLWNAGFYQRQKVGYGKYFDPDFMQHYGGADLASLAREVPRLEVRRYGSHYYAFGRLGGAACRMNTYVDGVLRREALSGNPYIKADHGLGLDEIVPKEDVYAVEVYPSINSLPSEFTAVGPKPGSIQNRPARHIPTRPGLGPPPTRNLDEEEATNDLACGAIAIWTKWHAAALAQDSSRRVPPPG